MATPRFGPNGRPDLRHATRTAWKEIGEAARRSSGSPIRLAMVAAAVFLVDVRSVDSGVKWPPMPDLLAMDWWATTVPALQFLLFLAAVLAVLRFDVPLARWITALVRWIDGSTRAGFYASAIAILLVEWEVLGLAVAGRHVVAPVRHEIISVIGVVAGSIIAVLATRLFVLRQPTPPRTIRLLTSIARHVTNPKVGRAGEWVSGEVPVEEAQADVIEVLTS